MGIEIIRTNGHSQVVDRELVFLTCKGYGHQLAAEVRNGTILEVDPNKSVFMDLLDAKVSKDAHIEGILPPRLSRENVQYFHDVINNAVANYKGHITDFERHEPLRSFNVLDNMERILGGITLPANELTKGHADTAFIVGNGWSLLDSLELLDPENTFCAWHPLHKLVSNGIIPRYVGHIDVSEPVNDYEPVDLREYPFRRIAFPTASSKFVDIETIQPLYLYLGGETDASHWFLRRLGWKLLRRSSGSIITMLIHSALYAGYRKIVLVGVDLCLRPGDDNYDGHNLIEFEPGKLTSLLYRLYMTHINDIAISFPDIQFFNASRGLTFPNMKAYKP